MGEERFELRALEIFSVFQTLIFSFYKRNNRRYPRAVTCQEASTRRTQWNRTTSDRDQWKCSGASGSGCWRILVPQHLFTVTSAPRGDAPAASEDLVILSRFTKTRVQKVRAPPIIRSTVLSFLSLSRHASLRPFRPPFSARPRLLVSIHFIRVVLIKCSLGIVRSLPHWAPGHVLIIQILYTQH